jgi:dipeptidase E
MTARIFLTSNTSNVFSKIMRSVGHESATMVVVTTALEAEPNPEPSWLINDRLTFSNYPQLQVFEYSITGKTLQQIETDLAVVDILYVTGGNVFYLLEQSQETNFITFVRSRVASGTIYIGHSAGAIIAGPNIEPAYRADKALLAKKLQGYAGYGIVDIVTLPHWGSDYLRNVYFTERLERVYNEDYVYLPLTDYQYASCSESGIIITNVHQ